MKRRLLALLLACTMIVAVFGACNKDEPAPNPTEPTNPTQPSTPSEPTTPTTPPSGDGELDAVQEYNVYLSAEPNTLDLSKRSDTYSYTLINNTKEALTRVVYNDSTGQYDRVPGGAKTWEVSADNLVWTFKLQDNKWSDGQPVTAKDYVYSIRRTCDPATGSPMAYSLNPIKNFEALNTGKMDDMEQLGVKAIDDTTLEITLEAPCPYFLELTHDTLMSPQRQDMVEKNGDKYGTEASTVLYCGPFKITEWVHNTSVTFEKNEHYWDAENVKLSKVNCKIMTESTTANNAFLNGELDSISTGEAEWIEKFKQLEGVNYNAVPSANITYSFFNCKDAIFQNANIRKAFILGVDREELNEMCFGGARVPMYGWVVPAMGIGEVSFREYAGEPIKDMLTENPDPKALLLKGMEELGLGTDPATLKVTWSLAGTSQWFRTLGDYLQQIYKSTLGVNMEISFSEWGIFSSNVEDGNFQIGFMGWGAGMREPYDVLSIFMSNAGAINTGWVNEEYDNLITQASTEMDDQKRLEIYKQAEDILLKQEGVVNPLACSTTQYFVREYVKGMDMSPMGNPGWKNVYISGRK